MESSGLYKDNDHSSNGYQVLIFVSFEALRVSQLRSQAHVPADTGKTSQDERNSAG
jgi:hypothetical protein